MDIRHGLAYRPLDSPWIVLNRLDLIYEETAGGLDTNSWRIVNRLSANYQPYQELQVSLHYGSKYVLETIEDDDFDGYTDFIGIEARHDITERIDIGVRGSALHSWNGGQVDYAFGPIIGFNLATNMWLSLGYNVAGFYDRDFSKADYTARGPYVQFRMKFDQNTITDLNDTLKQWWTR